jgi:hypothetical protein
VWNWNWNWNWQMRDKDKDNRWKADDSEKSFLFTLKNLHNIAPRIFALNPALKHRAISCDSELSPHFYDMVVSDNCNVNTRSTACLDDISINDTGREGERVLVSWRYFGVKEIEIFELTD